MQSTSEGSLLQRLGGHFGYLEFFCGAGSLYPPPVKNMTDLEKLSVPKTLGCLNAETLRFLFRAQKIAGFFFLCDFFGEFLAIFLQQNLRFENAATFL